MWLSSTQIARLLRSWALQSSTGITASQPCTFVAILCAFGERGDPYLRVARETLTAWFQFLNHIWDTPLLELLKQAWPKIRDRVRASSNVSAVRGLASNVVYLLKQFDW